MAAGAFPRLPAYPVKQRLEIGGVNVVLLSVPPGENYPQNIFGVTEKGDVLWQIEPRPSKEPANRYTSIRDELGLIVAKTEDGCQRKVDARSGRVPNANLAEYAVPVHADTPAVIDVIFVEQDDPHVNPLGVKRLAELAIVGVAPAITNAVFHATGKRLRELPVTPDKLL